MVIISDSHLLKSQIDDLNLQLKYLYTVESAKNDELGGVRNKIYKLEQQRDVLLLQYINSQRHY